MATLTAQSVVLTAQYQLDGTKNTQEAPGDGVFPADGSNLAVGGTGLQTSIFTIPQPGKGFPTGKDATHSTGTYPRLSKAVIQQPTRTIDIDAATRAMISNPAHTSTGFAIAADGHVHAGMNDLQNTLLNDVSNMVVAPTHGGGSIPTPATGTAATDGLSQSPETLS
jgi:hypothetical protein